MRNIFKRKQATEQGFTLVEILVAVALFVVITGTITAAAITMSNSVNKFTESTTISNQAADTISLLTREISSASNVNVAQNYYLNFITSENGTNYEVTYFIWNPDDNTGVTLPESVSVEDLPAVPAIMQLRKPANSLEEGTLKVLVEGYDIKKQTFPLFVYYNDDNMEITTPVTGANIETIERIDYGFVVSVVDREGLIELYSSTNPRF